jgi:hypothetical protein
LEYWDLNAVLPLGKNASKSICRHLLQPGDFTTDGGQSPKRRHEKEAASSRGQPPSSHQPAQRTRPPVITH